MSAKLKFGSSRLLENLGIMSSPQEMKLLPAKGLL